MLNAAEKSNCMIKLMVIEDYSEIGWRETSTATEVAVLVVVEWSQNRLLGHEWAEPLNPETE
jgi:hypothetical protein